MRSARIGVHGPPACSAKDSVIGVLSRFLSWAVQLMHSLPLPFSLPTSTPCSCTTGLVRSTSTHTCGRSPSCGARSPSPTPLLATSVKPYTPSCATGTVSGEVKPVSGGFFSGYLFQLRPSCVNHSSSEEIPDGPLSLISKLRLIVLVFTMRRSGSSGDTPAFAAAPSPSADDGGCGFRAAVWPLRLTFAVASLQLPARSRARSRTSSTPLVSGFQ